jgi:hypothetical protein
VREGARGDPELLEIVYRRSRDNRTPLLFLLFFVTPAT